MEMLCYLVSFREWLRMLENGREYLEKGRVSVENT